MTFTDETDGRMLWNHIPSIKDILDQNMKIWTFPLTIKVKPQNTLTKIHYTSLTIKRAYFSPEQWSHLNETLYGLARAKADRRQSLIYYEDSVE